MYKKDIREKCFSTGKICEANVKLIGVLLMYLVRSFLCLY